MKIEVTINNAFLEWFSQDKETVTKEQVTGFVQHALDAMLPNIQSQFPDGVILPKSKKGGARSVQSME